MTVSDGFLTESETFELTVNPLNDFPVLDEIGSQLTYEDEPLECPLTAFAGKNDSVFSEDQIQEWSRHTSNEFKYEVVEGSHLFCRDNKEDLLKIITEELS